MEKFCPPVPGRIVFLDTETTGLDATRHEIWEFGAIVRDPGKTDVEVEFQIMPEHLERADPFGLKVGRFWDRIDADTALWAPVGAEKMFTVMHGAQIVGLVPQFDAGFIDVALAEFGLPKTWHYHLIDVEPMMVGWLAGSLRYGIPWPADLPKSPPWASEDLSRALGIDVPTEQEKHTALGDARWVRRIWDALMGEVQR